MKIKLSLWGIFLFLLSFASIIGTTAFAENISSSDIIVSDKEFTTVGMSWEADIPDDTSVELELRLRSAGKWSEWVVMEGEPERGNTYIGTVSSNESDAFQYNFIFESENQNLPTVKNVTWEFIKAPPRFTSGSIKPSSLVSGLVTRFALTAGTSGVITRGQWGADENYRYLTDQTSEPDLIEIPEDLYKRFADELTYSRVVKTDDKGKKYKWPLQYPEKVKKIIIHHTATTGNLSNPAQAIRDIYYYHAISRGWGDIGYNYIVDRDGKVYEGRYGGEGVIGAHAGIGNNGSIGIAVLGDYESTEVPKAVINSVSSFVQKKAKIHDIDSTGTSVFRGKDMPNIFGHKDIMPTACPGSYLYEKLPIVRTLAKKIQNEKPKFVKDYDFQNLSDTYYIELTPGEVEEVIIKMENIGKVNWDSKTFIVVDENPAFKDVVTFPTAKGVELARMQESTVKPGDTATFKFQVKGGKKGETVYMNIAPLINGSKKISDYVVLPVTVQQSDFKYEFVDSKLPAELDAEEVFDGWVKLKNTGNTTWRKGGDNTVLLGTDHPRDRKSLFVSPPSARIGYLQETEVKPGATGTFNIKIKAPKDPGYYQEYFTPVVEGITWMRDSGMKYEVLIAGGDYAAELSSKSDLNKWKQGKSYVIWMKLRNLGKQTWNKSSFKIDFLKEQDLKITNSRLIQDSVKPGDIGMIEFTATVDPADAIGLKSILVKASVNGKQLTRRPMYFYYNVEKNGTPSIPKNSSSSSLESEKDIRVKISFSGDPVISANNSFAIYDNNNLITTLEKNETATVTYSNSKYQIKTSKNTYSKSGPIRFVPQNSGIMSITNFERRPSWNTSLNDNEFRGILETRYVDGKLVVINELPLESYLKGLAEPSNSDPIEKVKAVMIAARTYARYYLTEDQKFPGKPYHLDDDPAVSQNYLGYGFEKRSTNIVSAVNATKGEVVYYQGKIVKTPYFSSTDGTKTRSAKDVWNWDAPYLVSVDDSSCKNTAFAGHGVGLSGCGSKGMAEKGSTYTEILKHYYTGVEIVDLY